MNLLNSIKVQVLLIFLFISVASSSFAADYYISPNGSDKNSGTLSSPWATFAFAMDRLTAGDTLYIKDGTYTQSLDIKTSGKPGMPVTFKALNDGQVTIDGQNVRIACYLHTQEYIDIEGIICKNASKQYKTVDIKYSNNINFRRVSSYVDTSNASAWAGFQTYNSTNILLEDVAAYGDARILYNIYESDFVTIRRAWGSFKEYNGDRSDAPLEVLQLYGSNDAVIENSIFTKDARWSSDVLGIALWAHTYNKSVDSNKIYGNVVYGMSSWDYWIGSAKFKITDNEFINNVSIGHGLFVRADDNLTIQNMTFAGTESTSAISVNTFSDVNFEAGWSMNGTLKNSSISDSAGYGLYVKDDEYLGTFVNTYNNYYNNVNGNYGGDASKGANDHTYSISYNTDTFGKGAYLMIPHELKGKGKDGADIGAEVLYRYENGIKKNIPLWPWPMEDRICKETGYSVTYENGYSGCSKGGGLWKTLNGVYDLSFYNNDNNNNSNDDSNNNGNNDYYSYIVDIEPEGTYIEAENFKGSRTQEETLFLFDNSVPDYAGTGYLQTSGNLSLSCSNVTEGKQYEVNFTDTGVYNVWIRGKAKDYSADSVFIGVNGKCVGAIRPGNNYNQWVWSNILQSGTGINTINITSPGVHTFNIWVREPDFLIDSVYLTQGTEIPPDDIAYFDSIPPAPPAGLIIE